MLLRIYAIKDEKSGYDRIFSAQNDAFANRDFSVVVRDENSMFHNYPNDFSLWRIGELETTNGILEPSFEMVSTAKNVIGE